MVKTKSKLLYLYVLAIISLIFLLAYFYLEKNSESREKPEADELQAAKLMQEAEKIIFSCRQERGIPAPSSEFDPNQTGLIGLEYSSITTTLGNLEAKRTTTNPNLAALMVHLLKKAGVKKGDTVAAGASGSFPALIVATYCAARAMETNLLVIISLGASQWGANNPQFSWLEMEGCLRASGFNQHQLLALSWGGEDDSGQDFPPDFREKARRMAEQLNLGFIEERDFESRVQRHLELYSRAAGSQQIKAFINIGGSSVNLGLDSSILKLEPGLTRVKEIPPPIRRGLIQEMARLGVPVIHLLNIRRLAQIYNLPWDPQPLPQPGENIRWGERALGKITLIFLFAAYVLVSLLSLVGLNLIQRKGFRLKP